MSTLDRIFIAVTVVTGLWWAFSRRRHPHRLQQLSVAAPAVAALTLVFEGVRWQMVPWLALAVAIATAAALRRWRPGRSRRWRRVIARAAVGVGLLVGSLTALTAFVPTLPTPTGPHHVASEIFRWTDDSRAETLTPDPADHRQVVAQAWYPTDATGGRPVPYFEAQDRLPGSVGGVPSFFFSGYGRVRTHATLESPVSSAQPRWPVLLFSTGLGVPREEYTALCTELASRGYVVVALSTPYESAPTVLPGGRVVGQTVHPDVMGPAPHPELERLIDIRVADVGFVLDQLTALARVQPASALAGHLDLRHVGIVGHSLGGATAVQAMGGDRRLKVGVNLDGKLFGAQPEEHLRRPFLWIQSGGRQTDEYTGGRDRLLGGLRGGGALLTFGGSIHMGFSDAPSQWTAAGRGLIGGLVGVGSNSVAHMTSMTADAIVAFAGHALGVRRTGDLAQTLNRHPAIRIRVLP